MKTLWIMIIASLPLAGTTVLIANGEAVARRGQVRAALLVALTELAQSSDIADACIHASARGGTGSSLKLFGIPTGLQQRFRNVWSANSR